jgi:hypothetical protein
MYRDQARRALAARWRSGEALHTLETRDDLAGLSMPPNLRFLEDWFVVGNDLEAPPARWNELDGRVRKPLLDLGRQPGGPGLVASEGAVLDGDAHGWSTLG